MIFTGLPVVSMPYMPAALIPMPCWPRLIRSRWNLEPYSSLPKINGICGFMMPGPLSCTATRNRSGCVCSRCTQISGTMPASSQASSELSTASLTVVSSALRGLSKPSRWRFLAKNSLTEISRCLAAIASAVARRRGWPLLRRRIGFAGRLAVARRIRRRRGGRGTTGLLFAFHLGQRSVLLDPRGFRSGDRGGPTQGAEPAAARIGLWVREDGFQRFGL